MCRYQGPGGDDADITGVQQVECVDLRACDPRVHDVADNGDAQPPEIRTLDAADGEHVQHGLCRVRMPAVTGIDNADMRGHVAGDKVCGAAVGMADHEHVDMHRLEVAQGVQQTLALDRGRLGDVDIEYVCRQALGREFEGGAGARAGLEKQVDDGLAAQQRDLLDRLLGDPGK